MSEWPLVQLGEVCRVVNGGTPSTKKSDYWGGEHRWITPAEMGKGSSLYRNETVRTLTESGLRSCTAALLPPFSVILSSRAPIGHLVINTEPMATNQGCKGLIPLDGVQFKYLYYFLLANKAYLNELGSGTTFAELSGSSLKAVKMPVPPVVEQERIVKKLDKIHDQVAQATSHINHQVEDAESLRWAVVTERLMVSGPGQELPSPDKPVVSEWALKFIGDLLTLEYGKALPQEKRVPGGAYPAYGANGVKARTSDYLFHGDSIIIGRKGSAGSITRVSGRWWPLDVTYYVLPKSDQLDIDYLHLALGQLNLPSLARGVKPGINRNDVYKLQIPVPSLGEQRQIIAELEEFDASLARLHAQLAAQKAELAAFQSAALSEALSGGS